MARSRNDIARRLRALPDALEKPAAEICRRIKCAPNAWSQYAKDGGKRKITMTVANRLCDEFDLSLDWIYRGDRSRLPKWLYDKLAA